MSLLGFVADGIKEITGMNELEKEKGLYKEAIDKYNILVKQANEQIYKFNTLLNKVNSEKEKCIKLINLYGLIDKKNKKIEIEKIEEVIAENNFDMNKITSGPLFSSLLVGGALSFGTYTATSIFGIASTGTAIATLSGAAATNATLAALGGGALAIGGGGMAAGTAVLGVIAIVPAVLVSVNNFRKAGKIEDERKKTEGLIYDLKIKINEINKRIPIEESFLKTVEEKRIKYNNKMQLIIKEANEITKNFTDQLKTEEKKYQTLKKRGES